MIINGFDYTDEEIMEALKKKGYTLLHYRTYNETHIHGSGFTKEYYNTKCAVKAEDLPNDDNIWHKIARKEFEKKPVKPSLV